MVKKAFRFGVVTGGHASSSAWITLAQRVEELGYSSLLVPDVLGFREVRIQLNLWNMLVADSVTDENLVLRAELVIHALEALLLVGAIDGRARKVQRSGGVCPRQKLQDLLRFRR